MQPIPEEPINKKAKPIKIVWISNFKPLKQPELFIKLAEGFHNIQNVQFIMIGRPSSGAWQKELAEEINQLPNLEYMGEQSIEQVNKVLSESHILVNTSRYEGFSNTYIQAWMRRVPVVTLNADPDSMIEAKGFGYHSRTFQQMLRDVRNLATDQNLRENMGEKSRKFALKTFSTSNVESLINLLGQL
jgi:glycosyltransferase involved in cell wall biosynthesis